MNEIFVVKRDGSKELLNYEKVNKVLLWATEGINGVNASDIAMNAELKIEDGVSTKDIHKILIKSTSELITVETPNYQYVGSKLVNYLLRKEVFNTYDSFPRFFDLISNNIERGVYEDGFLINYTKVEIEKIESYIKHDRDEEFTYAGIQQLIDKYLVRDRYTGQYYETPQFAFMLISMAIYSDVDDKRERLKMIKEHYDLLSNRFISLSTPVIAGIRTPNKQFSSCTLINIGDSLESIAAGNHAIMRYVANKAGIGVNIGIRGVGASVNNGEKVHTGVIPFIKTIETTVNSCSQGGIRKGSATAFYPFFHIEIEDIVTLKNNANNDINSARRMDHAIQLNRLFYNRFIKNENITLFQLNDVADLYDAFSAEPIEVFEKLYVEYENDPSIEKETINARDLMSHIAKERVETGRIYIQNIDNANTYSSFLDAIRQSNLCTEITLPTTPLKSIDDTEGEIALCVLAAFNLGKIKNLSDIPKIAKHIIRTLDRVIDIQDYIVEAAKKMVKRRSVGVGVTNFAYWLAKNDLTYDDPETLVRVDELFEHISFSLIEASMELAKERGACEWFDRTKYSLGILPVFNYNKHIDKLTQNRKHSLDWEGLKKDVMKYGMRNSTVMALMPCESSSLVTNSTNGIEPIKSLITIKSSKANEPLPLVVPEIQKLRNKYQLAFTFDNTHMNKVVSVMQKWIDQGISVNHYYDKRGYDDSILPLSIVVNDILEFYKYGGKQLYYSNSLDNSKSMKEQENTDNNDKDIIIDMDEDNCEGGACAL